MPVGSVVLGGVTLNPSLQWVDRIRYAEIAQEQLRTLGGSLVINSARLYKGQPITMEAQEDTGWLTKLMVNSLLTKTFLLQIKQKVAADKC